jgi:hypothetical protein
MSVYLSKTSVRIAGVPDEIQTKHQLTTSTEHLPPDQPVHCMGFGSNAILFTYYYNYYIYTPGKETVYSIVFNSIKITENGSYQTHGLLQSCNVYQAAYDCEWYDAPPSFKTSIQLIMRQAQKARTLTAANFCSVNMETFTVVCVHDPDSTHSLL